MPLPPAPFARNDVGIVDPASGDLEMLGQGLRKVLYNFMHGVGLDADVRDRFDVPVPRPKLKRDFIARALSS